MKGILVALGMLTIAGCHTPGPAEPPEPTFAMGRVEIEVETDSEADDDHADVLVDGNYIGNGDMYVSMTVGEHVLRVELHGHAPFERVIYVIGGEDTQEFLVLLRKTDG